MISILGSGLVGGNGSPGSGTGGFIQFEGQAPCTPAPGTAYCFSISFSDPTRASFGSTNFFTPPTFFDWWLLNPPPGGGESSKTRFTITGDMNPIAFGTDRVFVLNPTGERVVEFAFDGSKIREYFSGIGGAQRDDLAYDPATNSVLVSMRNLVSTAGLTVLQDGQQVKEITSQISVSTVNVDTHGGFAAVANFNDGDISIIDLALREGIARKTVGNGPWSIGMTSVNGTPVVAVLTRFDGRLSVFNVPGLQLQTAINLQQTEPTQLAVFSSGIAAVLSEFDKEVVIVSLVTGQQLRRLPLSAPIRIAADEVNNVLWTANFGGKISKIDLQSFTVSDHPTATTVLPVRFTVRNGQIFISDGTQLQVLPPN